MPTQQESIFTMEGHFDQDLLSNANAGVRQPSAEKIVSISKARLPNWVQKVAESLLAIVSLSENWDSYGAKRIPPNIAKSANDLLCEIMHPQTPAPQIVPISDGGIQLEWHTGGIDLEIEIKSISTSTVYFYDHSSKETEWEGEINYDLSKLVRYVNLLTSRIQ